jgi:hypothetical protein
VAATTDIDSGAPDAVGDGAIVGAIDGSGADGVAFGAARLGDADGGWDGIAVPHAPASVTTRSAAAVLRRKRLREARIKWLAPHRSVQIGGPNLRARPAT